MSISYLHPNIQTNIYDNSEVVGAATTSEVPTLFQVYFSEKGESDTLKEYQDVSKFLSENGNPNFRRYGQSSYNIVNWLSNGGRVLCTRLTAEDAVYANLYLNVKTKANDDGTVSVKLMSNSIENLTVRDDDSINSLLAEKETVDEEGYTDHILFLIRSKGKGAYGNNYSIRITSNAAYNKTYNFACYNFTVMETSSNGSSKTSNGPISFSFYPEAMTAGGISLMLNQIVDTYFDGISCYCSETAYDKLIDDIMVATNNAYDEPAKIDFIFGDDKVIISEDSNTQSLFSFTGCYLLSGSDGSIGSRANDPAAIEVRNQLISDVFKGVTFPELFDKRRYPIDVVLDSNYDITLKTLINDFVNQRGDCITLLDTGDQPSAASTVAWKQTNMSIDDYFTSFWSQTVKIFDEYTATDIEVSPTYFLSQKIPAVDSQFGIHYPFVGPNRGVLTGFKKINWSPNEVEKESLYENQINYIEDGYKSTKFMSQLTAQSKNTSLSDINHVRTMLKIVRAVEDLMEDYLFEFGNEETLGRINSSLTTLLSSWVTNGACKVCKGLCSQTAIEKENKTAHVTIEIVFTDVIEKIIIDVNITR